MLNIDSKQILSLNVTRMKNVALLSFVNEVREHVGASAVVQEKTGHYASDFLTAVEAYNKAYNPSPKDLLTDDLKALDASRDKALVAWHTAILAAQKSPNAQKATAAKQLVQTYKDYHVDASAEYMQETTNIAQMLDRVRQTADMAMLDRMGLTDYLEDLTAKNAAFAATMSARTAGTVGKESGVVKAARETVEKAYRGLITAVNVVSLYEGDGGLDGFIDTVNAEVGHYRQILARSGSGSSSEAETEGETEV